MNANKKRILIGFLLALITALHYLIDGNRIVTHILHRELFFIPIILGAFWFGKRGGLMVAVLSSLLFLPKMLIIPKFFMMMHTTEAFSLNALLEIPVYLAAGYLIGHIQDIRHAHWRSLSIPPETRESSDPESVQKTNRRVLLCVYNTPSAPKIARYVMNIFTKDSNLSIDVLGFAREPSETAFDSAEEYRQAKSDNEKIVSELVQSIYRSLIEDGFSGQAVTKDVIRFQKETTARRIVEAQQGSSYDTVVVPGEKMSRTEEFVMGNTAVKLVRELDCPVVTVH